MISLKMKHPVFRIVGHNWTKIGMYYFVI